MKVMEVVKEMFRVETEFCDEKELCLANMWFERGGKGN